MFQTNTLQTPKSGRSRFSKALPAPPPSSSFEATPAAKQLPSIPSPPPRSIFDSDKPLPSPVKSALPPLPPMSIPRRPVGTTAKSPSSMSPLTATRSKPLPLPEPPASAPAPGPPPSQTVAPPPELAPVSPVGSISSLLSAYSRTSGESLVRGSDGSGSQRDSEPTLSPTQDALRGAQKVLVTPSFPPRHDGRLPQLPSPAPAPDTATTTPVSPPDAVKYMPYRKQLPQVPPFTAEQRPATPKQDSPAPAASSPAAVENPSPQIWRRRSLKSERGVDVPSLKLAISHGSTASSQLTVQSASQTTRSPLSASTTTSPLPPRSAGGLPGRNIRPVAPPQETAPVQVSQDMGSQNSKPELAFSKPEPAFSKPEPAFIKSRNESSPPQPPPRLPTPEYEKEDVRSHIPDPIVSPLSPASSPEPVADEPAPPPAPVVRRKEIAGADSPTIRNLPESWPTAQPSPIKVDVPSTVIRDFAPQPVEPAERLSGTPAASNSTAPRTAFPPRTSSTKPRTSSDAANPGLNQEPKAEVMEYREQRLEDLPAPDPRAAHFPTHTLELLPEGTIFKPLPVSKGMFNCYQKHRHMDRSRNRNYPLACQTCDKADAEDRWRCQWCSVRICESCLRIFNSCNRDLASLLDHLAHSPQSDRPASEGLETVME